MTNPGRYPGWSTKNWKLSAEQNEARLCALKKNQGEASEPK